MNYYLDIETTGLDPLHNKIITIQYMELDRNTAKPIGPLKILKEWESDEKTILKKFIEEFRPKDRWAFVPIGYGLSFEHKFFWPRCISNGLEPINILGGPFLDLMTVAVLMNKGEFKGASLHKMTKKPHSGAIVVQWYDEKKYAEIESYIKTEADEFSNFCVRLYKEMPPLLEMIRDGEVKVYKRREDN